MVRQLHIAGIKPLTQRRKTHVCTDQCDTSLLASLIFSPPAPQTIQPRRQATGTPTITVLTNNAKGLMALIPLLTMQINEAIYPREAFNHFQ
jgi:hypothetical protein